MVVCYVCSLFMRSYSILIQQFKVELENDGTFLELNRRTRELLCNSVRLSSKDYTKCIKYVINCVVLGVWG